MTSTDAALQFRIASDPEELDQIWRLNYRTFVEEIPQHLPNEEGSLPDKFGTDSTYAIALRGERVVGMLSARTTRPFSLDSKLADLDQYLPPHRFPCEIRLLAVEPAFRNGVVFRGLVAQLAELLLERGHDLAVISGTPRQFKLYHHLGFVPFGPLVGTAEAPYQPMYLTLERFSEGSQAFKSDAPAARVESNFLPGPTAIHPEVQTALATPPLSHRHGIFRSELRATRRMLCDLTGAANAQLSVGSGTLANDVVAGQLRLLRTKGVVLVNGEFGARLADHARRWCLPHVVHNAESGTAFSGSDVTELLDAVPDAKWVWTTHCETSTGVLNSVASIVEVCKSRGVKLALDSVSAVGNVPVDLRGVYLATATSGKGLGSYPGLAIIFHNEAVHAAGNDIPRYLDLGAYAAGDGVPFTHSSNLVRALRTALGRRDWDSWYAQVAADGERARSQLRAAGLDIVAEETCAAPSATTVRLPQSARLERVGRALEREGFLLSWRSEYLIARNWIQLCLMGEYPRERVDDAVAALAAEVGASATR